MRVMYWSGPAVDRCACTSSSSRAPIAANTTEKQAFEALLDTLGTDAVDKVYFGNGRGIRFGESCGFKPRSICMRYE